MAQKSPLQAEQKDRTYFFYPQLLFLKDTIIKIIPIRKNNAMKGLSNNGIVSGIVPYVPVFICADQ